MKENCADLIKDMVGKRHMYFMRSGNAAIKTALRYAKNLGYEQVFIQDQGGWLTYPQFIRRLKLDKVLLETELGVVDDVPGKGCALINSMPGYAVLMDMGVLARACEDKGAFLINDISGSVGTGACAFGDVVVCSLGKDKPLSIGGGGFLCCDEPLDVEETHLDWALLHERILGLGSRLEFLKGIRKRIIKDLSDMDVLFREGQGINVIVRYCSDEERVRVEEYCATHKFKYTLCPRYIRVNEKAISIEVKAEVNWV